MQIDAGELAAKLVGLKANSLKEWKAKAALQAKAFDVVDTNGNSIDAMLVVDTVAADMKEEDLVAEEEGETAEKDATAQAVVKAIETVLQNSNRTTDARIKAMNISGGEFRNDDKNRHGFKSMAEFGEAVKSASMPNGRFDDRLRTKASLGTYANEGVGADGGFAVPPTFRDEIWRIAFEADDFISQLSQEPTSGNSIELAKTETTPWGASGVQAYWEQEAAAATQSKPSLEKSTIKLNKLMALVPVTDEIADDAPRLNNLLTQKAGEAIAYKLLDSIINGDGVGKPQGYMNSGSLVTVAKESGQTAGTLVADNVAKMYARCINPSQCVWRVNQDVFPQLLTMTLGDNTVYVPPSSGFAGAPNGLLFGRPVQFSEPNATLGTVGDVVLVNPKGYAFVNKQGGGVDFQSSIHLWFDQATTAFRWTFRAGGQSYLTAPVTPAKGSSTRSHFVALATRA